MGWSFKPELLKKVMAGLKTQTRRPRKPGEQAVKDDAGNIIGVKDCHGRWKVRVGQTYIATPGRGKKGVCRYKVVSIREEDTRQITQEDSVAEGFANPVEFWCVWTGFYDYPASDMLAFVDGLPGDIKVHIWRNTLIHQRPNDKYEAWAYTFELVEVF